MPRLRRLIAPVLLAAVTSGLPVGAADAATRWAPASTATIHPGVQMFTGDAQCTANFVFTDDARRV